MKQVPIHAMMLALLVLCSIVSSASRVLAVEGEEGEAAEIAIGERLFLETRFAQLFFTHANGDANHELQDGDPLLDQTPTTGDPLPGPFAGTSINCRTCHLVDEQLQPPGGGMRTYADFAPAESRARVARGQPHDHPAQLVNGIDGSTSFHDQAFGFGTEELQV